MSEPSIILGLLGALLTGIATMGAVAKWVIGRTDRIVEQSRADFDRLSQRLDRVRAEERDDRHALGNRVHDTIVREIEGMRELTAATDQALRVEVREAERRCMEALARHKLHDAAARGPLTPAEIDAVFG